MAKKMFCPICDQPVKGRFCRHCGEFVTPYEHDVDYHMNESHDPKNDAGCDYHGTETVQTTAPAPSSNKGKKQSGVMIGIWLVLIAALCGVVAGVVASNNKSDPENADAGITESAAADDDETDAADAFVSDDDDMAFPFTQSYGEGYLSDDEYEQLLEENGFDEDGYKDLDYDEVLEAGEPCNGWVHFEGLSSRTAARHIRNVLEEAGIAASNYDADVETDNYYYMNRYGEIETYFQSYLYVTLDDDSYDNGFSGFLYLVSDSVTDELMAVCVKCDEKDTFIDACKEIMMELYDGDNFLLKTSFTVDVTRALADDDGYEYLEYGSLWFDLVYYDEVPDDDYQYTGWIYLGSDEENE